MKFLVGNKADLINERKISKEEANKYAEEHNLPYIETSAKEGFGVEELFDMTIKHFLGRCDSQDNNEKNIKLDQSSGNDGCCF